MRVLAPSSTQEVEQMLKDAITLANEGPVVIRYPKGVARTVDAADIGSGLAARKLLTDPSNQVCILAIGKMVGASLDAAALLAAKGITATVWDVRSCAPLDQAMIDNAAAHKVVITVEDGIREGGVGMTIEDLVSHATGANRPSIEVLGIPKQFIPQAKPDAILSRIGLDAEGIASTVLRLVQK
jgi:1-deoxy-D-xylulose-5-phosphate synthase